MIIIRISVLGDRVLLVYFHVKKGSYLQRNEVVESGQEGKQIVKNGRRDAHSYAEWDYICASPFSWDNAIDADQNATETVRVDYLKLKLKWILN